MSYLQPMDTRQYLYCLKPKPEYAEKAGVIKGVTVIGKLDIVWKTNLGERGRLQTSQLQRMVRQAESERNPRFPLLQNPLHDSVVATLWPPELRKFHFVLNFLGLTF